VHTQPVKLRRAVLRSPLSSVLSCLALAPIEC